MDVTTGILAATLVAMLCLMIYVSQLKTDEAAQAENALLTTQLATARTLIDALKIKALPWNVDDMVQWNSAGRLYTGYHVIGFAPANDQFEVPAYWGEFPTDARGQVSKVTKEPDTIVGKIEKGKFVIRRPMHGTLRPAA